MKLVATDTERARAAVLHAMDHLSCESIGEALAYALYPGGKLPDSTCRRGKGGRIVLEYYADAEGVAAEIAALRGLDPDEAREKTHELRLIWRMAEIDSASEQA